MQIWKLPREHVLLLVTAIQEYMDSELGQGIGEVAAENLLTFMLEQLGPLVYNQAIGDARGVLMQVNARAEEDLYALERPVPLLRRAASESEPPPA